MKKLWIGILLFALFFATGTCSSEAEDAVSGGTKIRIRNKEWRKETLILKDNRLYGSPELLSAGGRWTISREKDAFFAAIPVMGKGVEKVRLPVEESGLVDLSFFGRQAGLTYEWDEKGKTITFYQAGRQSLGKEGNNATRVREKGKIVLVWDPDSAFDPRKPFFRSSEIRSIISPGWGNYESILSGQQLYSYSYVEEAQKAGVAVMPMLNNGFNEVATTAFLQDKEQRMQFLRTLAAYTEMYGLDGWNIDFENMNPNDAEQFTEFIRDTAKLLHGMGKQVSVDIMPIGSPNSNWSGCYDRKALARYADYEILMGYDQTARGSAYAGSNCAYDWMERILPPVLEEVPAEKLILGLPFYTRVWTGNDGAAKAEVLTMAKVGAFSQRHKLVPRWQNKEKQFYADWRENGVRHRVWLEESRSLAEKLNLIGKYQLAGVAFWRYGFEPGEVYAVIDNALDTLPE